MSKKIITSIFILCFCVQINAQELNLKYDDFNRLVQVTYANGQQINYTYDKLGNRVGYEVEAPSIQVTASVFLQGPYETNNGWMNDALRQGLLLNQEPYTDLGFTQAGNGGGEEINSPETVLAVEGSDAIVDWILLELRDKDTPDLILHTRAALLQRDGDIVDTDGISPVLFDGVSWGEYYLSVRHRNHLGVMTAATLTFGEDPAIVDFTDPATPTWGTDAQLVQGGIARLWPGNTNMDAQVLYLGNGSDDQALLDLVLSNPANTNGEKSFPRMGYLTGDLNMDGKAVYQGSGSDKFLITTAVVSNPQNPTYDLVMPVVEQLPQIQMN